MIKVSVLYPNTPDGHFDMEYYTTRHVPMVLERCGGAVSPAGIERGIADAPYRVAGHLLFESKESMDEVLARHMAEFLADIPNFTNIQPTLQMAEVVL